MYAVVIDRLTGDPADLAQAAARAVGGTAYDVRASMMVPEGGPAVLAVYADLQVAQETRQSLSQAGFQAGVIDVKAPRPSFEVRTFELTPTALCVQDRPGQRVELPYASIDLLVRASSVTTTSTTTTSKERKFNLGRAVMSSGLINTKVKESTKTTRATDTDDLLYVYAGAAVPLRLEEKGMAYQGLGAAILPSRTANFSYLVDELRRRCPQAGFDERLRRMATQSQMLGRMLPAAEYLAFAVALVAMSRRGSATR
jgi:hypothetical protein